MEQVLVSVLMTAYNREKYISEAIESVLASTYKNFELIVVDDCSNDRTVELARSYMNADARVKVYINNENLGDYPNRNKAAGYATGKYIKYLDADDMIYPWGLETVVYCMEQYPDAGYGLDSIEQDPSRIFPFLLSPKEAYYRHYFRMPVFHKAPTSCIIKSEVFRSAEGFSGKWMVGDFELWHKLSRDYNVLLMPMGIVWSRTHEEQESAQIRQSSTVVFRYSVIALENLYDARCPLEDDDKKLMTKKIMRSQARSAFRSLLIDRSCRDFIIKLHLAKFSFVRALWLSV
jgi:glycosyltransferase involved in cell wall biosynthesis